MANRSGRRAPDLATLAHPGSLRSGTCAMYGEAILRASFHAGWPTLGGVPGRLVLYSASAPDPARTNHVQKICRLYNPEHIFIRPHHQTFWGVEIFPDAVGNPECAARRSYHRPTVQQPGGQFQTK